jgi:hypothetical protein
MKKTQKKYPSYEVGEEFIQCECTHAVFPKGGYNSMCYCTCKERAEVIAEALTMYVETPEFEKFLKEHGYDPTKKETHERN